MSRDPYIQREDERDWQDEICEKVAAQERRDRMLEKGSVSPQEARTALAALEPDSSPVPSLAFQGTPRAWPRLGFWRRVLRALGWLGFLALAGILALAFAFTVFMGVAWALSG